MSESFRPQYLTELPTPLAQFYHRSFGDDLRARHENLSYLFEAIVKLAVVPAISEYVHRIQQNAGARDRRVDKELVALGRPMLGQWVGMLRSLARYFERNPGNPPHLLSGLAAQLNCKRDRPSTLNLYCRLKNGVDRLPSSDSNCTFMQLVNALVTYRNTVKGHGTSDRSTEFLAELVPLLFEGMNDLLAELTLKVFGSHGSSLVLVREIRQMDGDRREVEMLPLTGLVPIERTVTRTVDAAESAHLQRRSMAFLWPDPVPPVSLAPLLIWKEVAGQAQPLVFNGGTRKPKYACFENGAVVDDTAMKASITDLLAMFEGPHTQSSRRTIALDYSLLPYMVNRERQERRIQRVLEQEMQARQPRAAVFILSGDAAQCHDKFKNRLVEFTLRKLYGFDSEDRVDDAFIRFPVDERERDEFDDELHWLLADKFDHESDNLSELAKRLTERAVLIYSELNTSDWNGDRERQVDWFLQFWQKLPEVWRKPPPVICLGVKYVSGAGFWDRRRRARRNDRAKKWLAQLNVGNYPDIRLEIMPELPNVKRGDVDNWRLKFERELRGFPNAELMEGELDRLFEETHEFPMQKLAPVLRSLLERRDVA